MPIACGSLRNFTCQPFAFGGRKYDTYRRGDGPGVILMHEIPGVTPELLGLAERIAGQGFHVVVPSLFGTPGQPGNLFHVLVQGARACISREFKALAANESGAVVDWLRALAREVYRVRGGKGIGAIGLCITGNIALALVMDEAGKVVAPVMGEPSLPLPFVKQLRPALHISAGELEATRQRIRRDGLTVLGLRFTNDWICPAARFETLRRELGESFEAIEIDSSPGNPHGIRPKAHSVLTIHLQDEEGHPTREALDRVLEFLRAQLR